MAVVADGGIAEIGPHEDLIALDGHYAALYGAWSAGLGTTAEL